MMKNERDCGKMIDNQVLSVRNQIRIKYRIIPDYS